MKKGKLTFILAMLMGMAGTRGFAQSIEVVNSVQNNYDSQLNFTYVVEQGMYSDYCDTTLVKNSWNYPADLLTQFKSVDSNMVADYDYSYDGGDFDFVDGRYRSTEDSLLVRISPAVADLTNAVFTLLNSNGEDLVGQGLIEVAGVSKFDGEDGSWVVKFKMCGPLDCNGKYAVAVNYADTTLISGNVLSMTAVKAKHAYDFAVNGMSIKEIHNRYVSTGESPNGSTTWTDDANNFPNYFAYELTWQPTACGSDDAYSSIIFNDNVCDRYDHDSQQQRVREWSGTDNRNSKSNLQCYFSADQAPEGETGEWAKIEIEFPQSNYMGEPTPIRGFFVTLDQHFSVETYGSELSAWTSYGYENVAKYPCDYRGGKTTDQDRLNSFEEPITLQEGNKGVIYIKNANHVAGDVIGFRVHAVNLDGTLTDPDGRAFYVEMAERPNPTISIVTDEQNHFNTKLSFADGTVTYQQGLYSDYCDKTLAQESWSFPGDYLSQLQKISSDYDYSFEGTGFSFVDGPHYSSPTGFNTHSDSLLFRVSPADTDLTDVYATLVGENADQFVISEGLRKYNDEEGLWVVKFRFRAGQAHSSRDPKSCALVLRGNDFEYVSDYVISFGPEYKPKLMAHNSDFVVNGVDINEIYNRYVASGTDLNGDTIWTDDPSGALRHELTWQPMACDSDDAYSSIIFNGDKDKDNVCDRYGHDRQAGRDVSGTDNRHNQLVLLCYFSGNPKDPTEDEWAGINIEFPAYNSGGIPTPISGFFVTLDQQFASDGAELTRWTSYDYKNVAKRDKNQGIDEGITLQSGNRGYISIKNNDTIKGGEVIGFRVHAVNSDGTLTDPDGRAFYVKLLQKGDVTGDGVLDSGDLGVFVDYFTGRGEKIQNEAGLDVTGDGNVDIEDLVQLIERIKQ